MWLAKLFDDYFFQLPLSGSLLGVVLIAVAIMLNSIFQLPLSGPQRSVKFRMRSIDCLSTPSLGITSDVLKFFPQPPDLFLNLSTPSLGITKTLYLDVKDPVVQKLSTPSLGITYSSDNEGA